MQICAVHGLRFDPSQHTGCVMCRRGTSDEAIDETVRERKAALKIGGAGGVALIVLAGLALILTLSSKPEPRPSPPAAAATPSVTPDPQTPPNAAAPAAIAPQEEPKELPPVLPVAGPAGEKPTLVPRMQLERAKEECVKLGPHAGGDYRCLVALTPLLELLTQIPVSTIKSPVAVRAYEMNRTGLSFDCLWLDVPELSEWKEPGRRDPQVYPYASLLVASPSKREAQVSLDLNRKPSRVNAEGALWPADYSVYATYDSLAVRGPKGRKAAARRYSACMTFPDDQPVTVYVGAAAWVGPGPSDRRDDGAAFRMASIALVGVKGAIADE